LKEQATALRPTPCQRLRIRSSSLAQTSASFRPPPPLLHPLGNMISLSPERGTCCPGSRRRHTGDFTRCPSDGETNAAVVRLLFGQSLSSGYGVGSPDRLFGFSSYSKRFSVRGDSLLFSFLWRREVFSFAGPEAGLDCWIFLIGLKETGHFV